jgi:hypothetical protein
VLFCACAHNYITWPPSKTNPVRIGLKARTVFSSLLLLPPLHCSQSQYTGSFCYYAHSNIGKGTNSMAYWRLCFRTADSDRIQLGRKRICYKIIFDLLVLHHYFLHNITIYNFSNTCLRVMDCALPMASAMDQSTETNQTGVLCAMKKRMIATARQKKSQSTKQSVD